MDTPPQFSRCVAEERADGMRGRRRGETCPDRNLPNASDARYFPWRRTVKEKAKENNFSGPMKRQRQSGEKCEMWRRKEEESEKEREEC